MKKLISCVLIISLLLYLNGCYSMKQVTLEEIMEGKNNPDIEVHTKDFNKYKFYHGTYTISQDTLYGKGTKIIDEGPFEGKIALKDISVFNVEKNNVDRNAQGQIIVKTNNYNSYLFEEGSYSFTADTLWGKGTRLNFIQGIPFEGKIPVNDIAVLDVNKFDTGNTALLVLGVGLIVALIGIIALAATWDNSMDNSASGCNRTSHG